LESIPDNIIFYGIKSGLFIFGVAVLYYVALGFVKFCEIRSTFYYEYLERNKSNDRSTI